MDDTEFEIQGDMQIALETFLDCGWHTTIVDKNVIDFRIFRTRANSNKQLFLLSEVLCCIHNLKYGNHSIWPASFHFFQVDEFQLIFKDRNEDKLLKQLMYALGHHMTGIIPNILFSAAQDAIRAMEPIMYSCKPLDLPLLWSSTCLGVSFYRREFTNVKEFFESLSKKNPSRIYTQISIKLDNAYKISAYANDHKMLICELIYRNIMEIKSNISNDLQDGDSTIKFEHLKRDKHLILRKLETERVRRNFN
ncbi:2943_t:CDS:2 [Funneliformis mosseae]|uniref:2943_t:CDS:1 n=1 Tax=Funneliformis mosseae TaxID=27381 RepID=A0A9N8ZC92_FUNMO|nr:2943_t:CDS:2 [Funneliformis mosseae]